MSAQSAFRADDVNEGAIALEWDARQHLEQVMF
jgi:hypothetical protein